MEKKAKGGRKTPIVSGFRLPSDPDVNQGNSPGEKNQGLVKIGKRGMADPHLIRFNPAQDNVRFGGLKTAGIIQEAPFLSTKEIK